MNKKILEASKDAILIGIGLVLVGFILQALSIALGSGSMAGTTSWMEGAYFIFLLVAFFCLYAGAGFRTTRKYGLSLMDAGTVGAFSYLIAAMVNYFLGVLALSVLWGQETMVGLPMLIGIPGSMMMISYSITEFTRVSAPLIIGGLIVNFVVGAGGGALGSMTGGQKKK